MLKTITWNQYMTLIGLATIGWYVYVLLRYSAGASKERNMLFSPADRTGLFAGDQPETPISKPIVSSDGDTQTARLDNEPDGSLVIQAVTQEIKTVIREAADQGISDAELAARLQVILSNYPDLIHTAYGIAVNDFITREANAVGFTLTKEEVVSFWE